MTRKVGKRIFASCLAFTLVSPVFYGLTAQKASAATTAITLDPSNMQQAWDGWGTALAWFGNVTGGWPDAKRNALADALYSPQGLNFNIARYNIGGGENPAYETMRQGGEVPGFSPSAGVYDWTQDANQRWWLQAAKARGANKLEAFSNSAPYYMTVSGSTTGHTDAWKDNLKSTEYDNFAEYLAKVVEHFDAEGTHFNTLSPVNEPNTNYWGFGGGQEGSHWDTASQAKIINATRAKLNDKGLQSVQISAMDETSVDTFMTNWNSYDATTKANIGQMNTHTYSGSNRTAVRDAAKSAGKPLWMSEVDLGPSGVAHNHDDFEPALALAERIMTDITWLEPKAWVLWQAIESEKNMQKENMNWGLLHADFDTQDWYYGKKYYAMAQFSKFIPQGSRFIADNNDNTLSAYDPIQNKIYVVYRNSNTSSQDISLNMSKFDSITGNATPYVSSATENVVQQGSLPVMNNTLRATVGAKSITTFVIDGASYTSSTVIPQSQMSVTATSAASGEGPEKTLDGNTGSNWHSAWSGTPAPAPHSVIYKLDKTNGTTYNDIYQLKYLPRQDSSFNGVATKYEVAVSTDGTNFTKVAEGTWSNDKSEKTATFSAVSASYVKFTVIQSNNGSGTQFGSAAEINIVRKPGFTVDKAMLNRAITSAEALLTTNPELTALQALVNQAKTVRDTVNVTQEDISKMAGSLATEYNLRYSPIGRIPQSQMTSSSTSSASGESSSKTLDGDTGTKWHTAYDGTYTPLPHAITYNLGKAYDGVYKLSYVPRQDSDWNGVVTKYEISVSTDGVAYTKVAEGAWDADRLEKTATFSPHGATYLKFTALESKSDTGKQYASAAEINIFSMAGFTMDKSSLIGAMATATTFMNGFTKDPSYLVNLQSLLTQGTALLSSATATQEGIVKQAGKITAEIANLQVDEQKITGIKVFYAPEAYSSNPASLMLDNNNSTYYETNWASNGRKYTSGDYLIIDLGQSKADVGKITITPRQDKANGRFKQFKVYYSDEDLTNVSVSGTQAYLNEHFTFVANGVWDASSGSVQTATFNSNKARYIAIQAITTGGDGNTLSAAEISVSQKQRAAFDTSSLTNAITQLRTASSISQKVASTIENQIGAIGTISDLTKESIAYYTKVLQDMYNLYATIGQTDSIKSGEVWLDGDGVPIQAHGGGILYNEKNKTYYWYGEDKTENNVGSGYVPVTGVHAYSSKDLYNWKNEGVVLPVFNNPQLGEDVLSGGNLPLYLDENSETYKNSGVPFDPNRVVNITDRNGDYTRSMKSPVNSLSKHNSPERIAELNALYADKTNAVKQEMYKDFNWDKVVERPKVVYNKKTDKYVMWWHQDGPIAGKYWTAAGGVAISDSPAGPFKYLGTFRLPNNGWGGSEGEGMLRDMTLFVDDDGNDATDDKAYLIYASEGNERTVITMLNDDYTGPATNANGQSVEGTHYVRAFPWYREAPAMFKQDGVYYMITSGQSGWDPNQAEYHVATNGIFGPWEHKGDPFVDDWKHTTHESQSTHVLPFRDGNGDLVPNKFIFMADRWYPSDLKDSRYVWLPIDLNAQNRTISARWYAEWDYSFFKTGTTVSFNTNGGSEVRSVYGAVSGSTITAPEAPTKNGFTFGGWYQNAALTTAWDFTVNTIPATDITLYAKWEAIAAPVITGVMPVSVATATYTPPVLPANVTVVYNNDTTATKSVQWNPINASAYAVAGTFSVNGTVNGTAIPAVANVTVTDNVYNVLSIAVTSSTSTITVKDGSLQLQASVLPANATNKSVAWSVYETDGVSITDKAIIDANGLLTAKKNGIVKVVATATDGSGIQGSNYIIISGQTPLPTNVPQATLTGPDQVQAGASFSTNFGLNNVSANESSSVYAIDMKLKFDVNAVNYVSVDLLSSDYELIPTITNVPGEIRIIAASKGAAGAITTSGDVFKINWTAKPNMPSLPLNFELTKVAVSNGLGQKVDSQLTTLMVSVGTVNKTTLQTLIDIAQNIYDKAVEGSDVGQYPIGKKAELAQAIAIAKTIKSNSASTQQEIDNAANVLNQAVQVFNEQMITVFALGDANEDNLINIGDLGTVALYFGMHTGSADWNKAKAADVVHDGKIDILDLTKIASLILE
ncbi:discoidin domain-containing protein [Paenibacillus sp. 2RAB27]|uniref:discoidin domain-containing protein n=1 Tax=Paenibacillus sp. 2RAB27 TaxID=3232991 RepID=UPI003F98D945